MPAFNLPTLRIVAALSLLGALQAQAAPIFAPVDAAAVLGATKSGTDFVISTNSPGAETPSHVVDGVGQKYLNFDKLNTGFILTPASGSTIAGSIQIWTANDAVQRDPASFELYGTNSVIAGPGPFPIASFTLIASGALSLPAGRNSGGATPLNDTFSETVTFANSTAYTTYAVIFPTVKDAANANSMQVAEVQLFTAAPVNAVPLPPAICLGLLMGGGVFFRRVMRK